MSKRTAPRTKGDCRGYVGEYGLRGTKPAGRTKLLAAGGEPAVSAPEQQESEPKPAPATRQLRERNPTALPALPDGREWQRDEAQRWRHVDCGGEVIGLDRARPFCRACLAEYWLDPRTREWKRFGM